MSNTLEAIITSPSLVREQWLPPELAAREVLAFERRFGSKHLMLACHAALPLILNPQLVNLIHINFLEDKEIPWVAEVDFLLSPLCRPIDEGLYEVEPSIREVLLVELENQFGWERPFQLAKFLQFYLAHNSGLQQPKKVTRTQQWIAQAYIDPDKVVEQLTNLFDSSLSEEAQSLSLSEQIHVTTTLELLAEPLERTNQQRKYEYLVSNSRVLAQILYKEEQELKQTIVPNKKVKEEALNVLSPFVVKHLASLDILETESPETESTEAESLSPKNNQLPTDEISPESVSKGGMQGDNRSIVIEKDAISSAIISGIGNKVVIYQYQLERQVVEETASTTEKIGSNPYKGLLAFHEEDGDRYFGREKQIEKLWNLFRTLHENTTQPEPPLRFLPILGASGCGKSSLARAGLIPELARRPLPGKSQARVVVLVPGTHPVKALAMVLARVATNDQTPVGKAQEFEKVLKTTNNNTKDTIIYDGLQRIANVLPNITVSPLVVLIDQFEEVYSLCEDTKERQIFIDNLIHAAGDRAGNVSVIITLRSDFLGETQRHPGLNLVIASQGALVPAMSEEELRRAITKPAELAGHPLDEAVITLLLKDTQGREGALPLLQFALTQIWEGLKKGVKPVKTLEDIGGVGGALADEAQRIYQSLNDKEKQIARRVFLGLVKLGEGTSDTRRRASVDSLVSHKDDPEDVKRVINRFAHPSVRLVTLSSEQGIETVEITHEALLVNWGLMREWLDSSRSDIRFQRRLDEAALHWHKNGRAKGILWRPPDLDLLEQYYQRARDNMTPLQVEFFQASVRENLPWWRKILS